MAQYIIKTDKTDKKVHILKQETSIIRLGMIYTDYSLDLTTRDIFNEEIIDPLTTKILAEILLYEGKNVILIKSKGKELASMNQNGEYTEKGVVIPYQRLTKKTLMSNPNYASLDSLGITHAYFLNQPSQITEVFCFEKEDDISGVVNTKDSDDLNVIKSLSLVLAKRIEDQEFLFRFLRK